MGELIHFFESVDPRTVSRHGNFVYMIRSGFWGPVKIGLSRDPRKRLAGLQIGSPERLNLIVAEDLGSADEASRVEGALHRKFKGYRMLGEWFKCDGELFGAICDWHSGASLLNITGDA